MTIYLTTKNTISIHSEVFILHNIFEIRTYIKLFKKLKYAVNVIDFYQRIGQLREY